MDEEKDVTADGKLESGHDDWLGIAADFDNRMSQIERRQVNLASRLCRLESGIKSVGSGDPMMEMIIWIMVLGIGAQILTPVLEMVVKKWQSSS